MSVQSSMIYGVISSFEEPRSEFRSKLGNHIYTVILLDNHPQESSLRKCAKISFYSLGIILSYGSLFPNVKLALSLENIYGYVTAFGVAFDFGTLGSWGFISMANKLLAESISGDKRGGCLKYLSTALKITLSVGAGWLSRIPSSAVALAITPDIPLASRVPLAALTILGRSWTNSYSFYETLNYIEGLGKSTLCSNEQERLLEVIKNNLASCIEAAQRECIQLPSEKRKGIFSSMYEVIEDGIEVGGQNERVQALFHETICCVKDSHQLNPLDGLLYFPKIAVRTIAVVPPVALMIQNTLLTKTALDYFIPSYDLPKWLFSGVVASTFSWVGIKYCAESAEKLFERFAAMFCENQGQTFTEKFYPKTSFILQLMAIALSALPYGEVTAVAKFYANPGTWYGRVFIEANFIASFLLIVHAMEDLFIEAGIFRFSDSRWADPEVKETLQLFRKLEKLKEIIQCSCLPEIRELLKEIDPEDIRKLFKDDSVNVEDIMEILDYHAV